MPKLKKKSIEQRSRADKERKQQIRGKSLHVVTLLYVYYLVWYTDLGGRGVFRRLTSLLLCFKIKSFNRIIPQNSKPFCSSAAKWLAILWNNSDYCTTSPITFSTFNIFYEIQNKSIWWCWNRLQVSKLSDILMALSVSSCLILVAFF